YARRGEFNTPVGRDHQKILSAGRKLGPASSFGRSVRLAQALALLRQVAGGQTQRGEALRLISVLKYAQISRLRMQVLDPAPDDQNENTLPASWKRAADRSHCVVGQMIPKLDCGNRDVNSRRACSGRSER